MIIIRVGMCLWNITLPSHTSSLCICQCTVLPHTIPSGSNTPCRIFDTFPMTLHTRTSRTYSYCTSGKCICPHIPSWRNCTSASWTDSSNARCNPKHIGSLCTSPDLHTPREQKHRVHRSNKRCQNLYRLHRFWGSPLFLQSTWLRLQWGLVLECSRRWDIPLQWVLVQCRW